MNRLTPLLWLCGPSGVGKTTVGWEMHRQRARAGAATAYVDADQLGLCYPAPAEDPYNHRIKARNLGVVWAAFRAAGADSVILSGAVESAELVREYAEQVADAALTLCRLRAGHASLTDRFVRRGWMSHLAPEALIEADDLDRLDFAELCVDTDGLSVVEIAQKVRDRASGWPPVLGGRTSSPRGQVSANQSIAGDRVPVLLLCGPMAVGKSTVGYEVFTQIRARAKAAYVDLAQIGFCRTAPVDDPGNHRLKAANLAAMWPAFRDAGARCLIVTGQVDDATTIRTYAEAFPSMNLVVCRLHADGDTLTERILLRARGRGPSIAGDELRGMPADRLRQAARRAARDARDLHRANVGDICIDTDGRSVADIAQQIGAQFTSCAGSSRAAGAP